MHFISFTLHNDGIADIVDTVPNFYKFDNNGSNKTFANILRSCTNIDLQKSSDIAVGFCCSLILFVLQF